MIVLISKDFEIIRHSEPLPGRLMNFLVKKTGKTLNFSVFYGHQWAKMNNEDIITVLKEFDNLQDPADKHLIMGDFNFVDVDVDKGKGMSTKDRMIKPHWDRITTEHGVVDPFRAQCPRKKIFSFTSQQGKSRGDRIYFSADHIAAIRNLRYIQTPFKTAHKILTFNIQHSQKRGPPTWKMNSSILNDQEFKSEIEDIFSGLEALQIDNPLDWWDLFISVVSGATISYTKRKARIKIP